jgi:tetratricopeptide (TPR) repeat protein
MDDLLLKGIAAARAGRRSEARAILTQVVEQDERNEQAWLWLSGVVDSPEDVRVCLENVLDLNPANARARQGLEWLEARYGTATPAPPAEAARPAVQPEVRAPAPTHQKQPTPAEPLRANPVAPSFEPLDEGRASLGESPCPFCGAPTTAHQQSCTQCRRSLMIQIPPPDQPSRWLGVLGGMWRACGALVVVLGVLFFAATVLTYQTARFPEGGEQRPDAPFPFGLLTIGAALLFAGLGLTRTIAGLRQRALPAYYAVVVLVPTLLVLVVFALTRSLAEGMLAAAPEFVRPLLVSIATALLVGLAALLGGTAIFGALAYRDFFGPMVRFNGVVQAADPVTHYNNGVAYKNRGMWYMAAREWERAVTATPRDINYLRALGLAYARIRHFDQARATLDRALGLAPGHAQIAEDRVLVEKLAAEAR